MKISQSSSPLFVDIANAGFLRGRLIKAFQWCAHRDYRARLVLYAGGGDGPRLSEYYYKSIAVAANRYIVLKAIAPNFLDDDTWIDFEVYDYAKELWVSGGDIADISDEVAILMGDFDD